MDRVSDPVRPSNARQFVRTRKAFNRKIAERHRKDAEKTNHQTPVPKMNLPLS